MLCQNCKMRNATVHIAKIVNNRKTEMYLCEACAREKTSFEPNMPLDISNFFAGFAGVQPQTVYTAEDRITCDGCGMTYNEFRRTGKMGCHKCYSVYGERVKPLLKSVHGSVVHAGKVPRKIARLSKRDSDLDRYRKELESAVRREDYERAAVLRDKIKELSSSRKECD